MGINLFGPNIQEKETKFFQSVGQLPTEQQSFSNIVDIAAKHGLPNPPKAAQVWLKEYDAHKKRLKEEMPGQPTGTVPLDLPLAERIKTATGLSYTEPAPIPAPLGMQGDLPMSLEDLASMLPPDFKLPSQVQRQQPELSVFGPEALSELPQKVSQPFVATDVVQSALKGITPPDFGDVRESLAKELFNKNYAALTPGEAGTVNTTILDREAEQRLNIEKELQPLRVQVAERTGVAAAVGKETALRKLPLEPEERAKYINPDTLTAPPPGLSKEEAINQGYIAISSSQDRDVLYDLPNVKLQIDTINKLVNGLITAQDAWGALTQGVNLKLSAWSKINPQAATYEDIRQAYIGVLSRRLGGERGVLTDRDIDRIRNSFPSFRDTAIIKDYKMSFINDIITMAVENQKRKLTGKAPLFNIAVVKSKLDKLDTNKIPVRIGISQGRKLYYFSDGTWEYAD